MRNLSLLLIFPLLIIACGEGNKTISQSGSTPTTEELNEKQKQRYQEALKPISIAWDDIDHSLHKYNLSCEDCPDSFGHVISQRTVVDTSSSSPKTKRFTYSCQGFMENDDGVVYTNRHCLPDDLKSGNITSCQGRIRFIMPKTKASNKVDVFECDEILAVSKTFDGVPEKQAQPDWVALQMTKKSRRFSNMNQEGLENGSIVYGFIPLVNPQTEQAEITTIKCTSLADTLSLPEYRQAKSPILRMKCDRDLVKGFSGMAWFRSTSNGLEPIGLHSHIWEGQENGEDIIVSQYTVATNFACLPIDDDELDPACEFNPHNREALKEDIILGGFKKAKEAETDKVEQWQNTDLSPVVWEKVDLEKLDQLPPRLKTVIERRLARDIPGFTEKGKRELLLGTIPVFAKCLKSEFVQKARRGETVHLTLPHIGFLYEHDHEGKVRVSFKADSIEARVFGLEGEDGKFILHNDQSKVDGLGHMEKPVGSFRESFNHGSYGVPACPEPTS